MDKQEAVEFLTKALPFANKGEDYSSDLDGNTIKSMEELLNILEEEYGELTLVDIILAMVISISVFV